MSLARLLTNSERPLFVVGSEKNAGKTATLNRIRAEARLEGLSGFGLCTAGWDGESSDHLTGDQKPKVTVFPNDLVLTTGDLLATAQARLELLWAGSLSGQAGRPVIGRCIRAGEVELVGPPTVAELGEALDRMTRLGARRVLVDGAADRKTPISAFPGAEVGLVFRPETGESVDDFARRVAQVVMLYQLPQYESPRPSGLRGEQVALGDGKTWTFHMPVDLDEESVQNGKLHTWLGGPLTLPLLDDLQDLGVKTIIVDDPSRLVLPSNRVNRGIEKGLSFQLGMRPSVSFVAVRCDGGKRRSLPPRETLKKLSDILAPIPVLDPWSVAPPLESASGGTP